jgi:3-isopropylmalate/(R)-2-methylmalate dehydratase large subunit
MARETLFDKIWNRHVVADLGDGYALLHVSRNIMHDGGGGPLRLIRERGYAVRSPELNLGTLDHAVTTEPGRTKESQTAFSGRLDIMRAESKTAGIALYDVGEPGQGIVHVIGPELGYTLPGTLLTCGDSHTCTHGGMGALAFGIGACEVAHVLATQAIVQRKPLRMRFTFDGALPIGDEPKDKNL